MNKSIIKNRTPCTQRTQLLETRVAGLVDRLQHAVDLVRLEHHLRRHKQRILQALTAREAVAKAAGRNPWPWIAATLVVGSLSPLLYLLTRKPAGTG